MKLGLKPARVRLGQHQGLSEQAVASGADAPGVAADGSGLTLRNYLGGTEGNEILTTAAAAVLTVLLIAEGITILSIGGLLSAHMFIGIVLIPPVALKLGSTGYRFARYYGGSPTYRSKGPPPLPLRVLAPVLVVSTLGVFSTGVWLLLLGHKSDGVLFLHKATFVLWGAVFAIHFLAHTPRMLRSLRADWGRIRRRDVPGSGLRGLLVSASVGAGLALALSLLSAIAGWQGSAG